MPHSRLRLRPLSTLVCALPLLAQAPEAGLAERLYLSGDRAYARQAYKEALDTWEQLLQSQPKSPFVPRILLRLAHHAVDVEHKPDAAMPRLERIRDEFIKSPEAPDALLLRGTLLAQQARRPAELKDATAEFHRVLDIFPEAPACAEARLRLGRALRDQGLWSRALLQFVDVVRLHTGSPWAQPAALEAAQAMDRLGDLPGSLRMYQHLVEAAPQSPEAAEATWRMALVVKARLVKPPYVLEGPWPAGRVKWLKTPTLVALAPDGDLLIYQNDLDRTFRLHEGTLTPQGPVAPGTRALLTTPAGAVWMLGKTGLIREDSSANPSLGPLSGVVGAALDRWGNLWVADGKAPTLSVFTAAGESRTVPSPTPSALVSLGPDTFVVASDVDRKLLFLDTEGQPRLVVPYGKDLPAAFRSVVALASDGAGQVAALVDGGDFGEGVILLGPDGTLLRQVTFKSLGLSGRFTALALDRSGGLILCDRRNDVLIRLN